MVSIIAILAAIVVPAFSNHREEAAIAATASDLTSMAQAVMHYHASTETYPSDVVSRVTPPELADLLPPNIFRKPVPITGVYDYNYGTNGGITLCAITIYDPTPDLDQWQALDELIDDGDLSTGQLMRTATSGYFSQNLNYVIRVNP